MGFSPTEKHTTTSSTFSNIVDASTGSFVETLTISGANVIGSPQFIHIQERVTASGLSGSFTENGWRTRVLNLIVDDGTGAVTLNSNQISLPAGTYEVEIKCPSFNVSRNVARLQNITDASTLLVGEGGSFSSGITDVAFINGRFSITGTKTIEIQHWCQATRSNDGFGLAFGGEPTTIDAAVDEIYCDAKFYKIEQESGNG